MSKKVLRIGCEYFDLKGTKPFNERGTYNKKLGDVYNTCSLEKIRSWNKWARFFEDDDLVQTECYGVASKNTFQYSIGAVFYSSEHDKYYEVRITANNRYAWELI